jgi:hypothetical protein
MGLTVIPTNIGGVQLPFSQLSGPLASLFSTSSATNLVFPADLASNPVMCHAVQFSIYDRSSALTEIYNAAVDGINNSSASTEITEAAAKLREGISAASGTFNATGAGGIIGGGLRVGENIINSATGFVAGGVSNLISNPTGSINSLANSFSPSFLKPFAANGYAPTKQGAILKYISLYMPDTLTVNYTSHYNEVELGTQIGEKGKIASAFSDIQSNPLSGSVVNSAVRSSLGKAILADAAGAVIGSQAFAQQALGQVPNPQVQLLYRGIDLRQFTLEFVFTPKSNQEAVAAKQIVDAFTYHSLPGLAGAAFGNSGQYLTLPQLFGIKFVFMGGNNIINSVANVFESAFTNIGLGFLNTSNPTSSITNNNNPAQLFTLKDCVLTDVAVDYVPLGTFATFGDGYPVQTKLTLSFKETTIFTKEDMIKTNQSTSVPNNYSATSYPVDMSNIQGVQLD